VQNQYAGDVGDYIKLALLRYLVTGRRLGIAWYLYPNEGHKKDGKHTKYLCAHNHWRHLDSELFDALGRVVKTERSVLALEQSGIIEASFSSESLATAILPWAHRSDWRTNWFKRVLESLKSADIVFADPDNGLIDDNSKRRNKKVFGKQIPLSEVKALAENRPAIIYHHNSRFRGGHRAEIEYWLSQLDKNALAIRANAYSCRTFFLLNPDKAIRDRVIAFCERWAKHGVSLHC
jgi:hypothetical protein